MMFSLYAVLLLQAGPLVSGGAAPPIRPVPLPRTEARAAAPATPEAAAPAAEPSRLQLCLQAVEKDPLAAIAAAEEWLKTSKGTATVDPNHCLGMAYTRLGRHAQAESAFVTARDALPREAHGQRASLGALRAAALFDQDEPAKSDAAFAEAIADAEADRDPRFAANLAIARAQSQMALKDVAGARAGLERGRRDSPDNAAGWLLSATLARRDGNLAEAQRYIERAAELAPREPMIGLEAGVIAMLSGREASARKSWESVLQVAPDSDAAKVAQGYLDQLDPAARASGPQPLEGR